MSRSFAVSGLQGCPEKCLQASGQSQKGRTWSLGSLCLLRRGLVFLLLFFYYLA